MAEPMEMTLEKEPSGNTLLIKDHNQVEYDNYQISMLLHNDIEGFLPCKVCMMNEELVYNYNAGGLCTLEYLYQDKCISGKQMERLVRAIDRAYKNAAVYLLDPGAILLTPQTIFANRDLEQILFPYLPGRQASFEESFSELAEFILQNMDYKDSDGVVLGYNIYRIAREEMGTFQNIVQLLDCPGKEDKGYAKERLSEKRNGKDTGCYYESERDIRPENSSASRPRSMSENRSDGKNPLKKNPNKGKEEQKKEGKKKSKILTVLLAALLLLLIAAALIRTGVIAADGITTGESITGGIFSGSSNGQIIIQSGADAGEGNTGIVVKVAAVVLVILLLIILFIRRRAGKSSDKSEGNRRKRMGHSRDGKVHNGVRISDLDEDDPDGISPTTCIAGTTPEITHKLVRTDTGDELILNRASYRIGKSREANDVCLPEETISRTHCILRKEQGEWYVEDLGSTNGTFVNGTGITQGEQMMLSSGDEIMMANIEFIYL